MNKHAQILKMAEDKGLLRPRDLVAMGIDPAYARRLAENGALTKMGRGLYCLPSLDLTENHTLAEVAAWSPKAVVCLLTAARYHHLGTEAPGPVWVALERGTNRPSSSALPRLKAVWFSPSALESGIETHLIEGVPVRITSPARTVVDLFRFRQAVGLETALEALRDALRNRVPVREILQHATRLRVQKRIQPYLEAML